MDKVLQEYQDPHTVGFCSFTRAARREASTRAGDRYGVKPIDLEKGGWFRTLHSICRKQLKVGGELLTTNVESRNWIREALDDEFATPVADTLSDIDSVGDDAKGKTNFALRLWGTARNRLCTLEEAWRLTALCEPRIPGLYECKDVAIRYQEAKALHKKVDFTDLLSMFAGFYCHPDGCERREPRGEIPDVPVWFLDEQQDASPLLHAVCDRLISNSRWCYCSGDPYQSIFGWAGADPKMFMEGWTYDKSRIMPKSWRCPAPILELGESVLKPCSDYFDRGIAPAGHNGSVRRCSVETMLEAVRPDQSWLILARTNRIAKQMSAMLSERGIPHVNSHGGGKWAAPVKMMAVRALSNLRDGAPIDGLEWKAICKSMRATVAYNEPLLVRGTKTKWTKTKDEEAADIEPWVMVDDLERLGATPAMVEQILDDRWKTWIDGAHDYAAAFAAWDAESVTHSKVRVGTIHSAKGSEADNVAINIGQSAQCQMGMKSQEGSDEARRVSYVGITRARHRLILAEPVKSLYHIPL
jgi:superfamily I DNA/RNA helicase